MEAAPVSKPNHFYGLMSAVIIAVTCLWLGSLFMIHDAYYLDRNVYQTQSTLSPNATGKDYISRAFRNLAFISAQMPVNASDSSI
jgi:hypothetical protein